MIKNNQKQKNKSLGIARDYLNERQVINKIVKNIRVL